MAGIVVGTDGSRRSEAALRWALREAALRRVPLTVLTVYRTIVNQMTGHPMALEGDDARAAEQRRVVEETVAKLSGELGDPRPISVSVRAHVGFPAEDLVAASEDADLVVVGSRGSGGFAKLLLGSVSHQVAHHAACPVVVVPHER